MDENISPFPYTGEDIEGQDINKKQAVQGHFSSILFNSQEIPLELGQLCRFCQQSCDAADHRLVGAHFSFSPDG